MFDERYNNDPEAIAKDLPSPHRRKRLPVSVILEKERQERFTKSNETKDDSAKRATRRDGSKLRSKPMPKTPNSKLQLPISPTKINNSTELTMPAQPLGLTLDLTTIGQNKSRKPSDTFTNVVLLDTVNDVGLNRRPSSKSVLVEHKASRFYTTLGIGRQAISNSLGSYGNLNVKDIKARILKAVNKYDDIGPLDTDEDYIVGEIEKNLCNIDDDMLRINVTLMVTKFRKAMHFLKATQRGTEATVETRDELSHALEMWINEAKADLFDSTREEIQYNPFKDSKSVAKSLKELEHKIQRLGDLKEQIYNYEVKGRDTTCLIVEKNALEEEVKIELIEAEYAKRKGTARNSKLNREAEFDYMKRAADEICGVLRRTRLEGNSYAVELEEKLHDLILHQQELDQDVEYLEAKLKSQNKLIRRMTDDYEALKFQHETAKNDLFKARDEKHSLEKDLMDSKAKYEGELEQALKAASSRSLRARYSSGVMAEKDAIIQNQKHQLQQLRQSMKAFAARRSERTSRARASAVGDIGKIYIMSDSSSEEDIEPQLIDASEALQELDLENSEIRMDECKATCNHSDEFGNLKALISTLERHNDLLKAELTIAQFVKKPQQKNAGIQVSLSRIKSRKQTETERPTSRDSGMQSEALILQEQACSTINLLMTNLEDQLMQTGDNFDCDRNSDEVQTSCSCKNVATMISTMTVMKSQSVVVAPICLDKGVQVTPSLEAILSLESSYNILHHEQSQEPMEINVVDNYQEMRDSSIRLPLPSNTTLRRKSPVNLESVLQVSQLSINPSSLERHSFSPQSNQRLIGVQSSYSQLTIPAAISRQRSHSIKVESYEIGDHVLDEGHQQEMLESGRKIAEDMLKVTDSNNIVQKNTQTLEELCTEAQSVMDHISTFLMKAELLIDSRAGMMNEANDLLMKRMPVKVIQEIQTNEDVAHDIPLEIITDKIHEKMQGIHDSLGTAMTDTMKAFIDEVHNQYETYQIIQKYMFELPLCEEDMKQASMEARNISNRIQLKIRKIAADSWLGSDPREIMPAGRTGLEKDGGGNVRNIINTWIKQRELYMKRKNHKLHEYAFGLLPPFEIQGMSVKSNLFTPNRTVNTGRDMHSFMSPQTTRHTSAGTRHKGNVIARPKIISRNPQKEIENLTGLTFPAIGNRRCDDVLEEAKPFAVDDRVVNERNKLRRSFVQRIKINYDEKRPLATVSTKPRDARTEISPALIPAVTNHQSRTAAATVRRPSATLPGKNVNQVNVDTVDPKKVTNGTGPIAVTNMTGLTTAPMKWVGPVFATKTSAFSPVRNDKTFKARRLRNKRTMFDDSTPIKVEDIRNSFVVDVCPSIPVIEKVLRLADEKDKVVLQEIRKLSSSLGQPALAMENVHQFHGGSRGMLTTTPTDLD